MQDIDKKSDPDHSENEKMTSARRRKNKLLLESHNHSLSELSKLIERIAKTDSNIFLIGSSTTSNEMVSRAIHVLSARSENYFSAVDCEQYSAEALEAYLFGVEKGAFSSSDDLQVGQLEYCIRGTILLNNIDKIGSPLQEKILRAITLGELERIGGHNRLQINVRLISSAQKNISEQVELGEFSAELFKCLNQSTISMPPLRRSTEDIPELISALTKNIQYAADNSYVISEDALNMLSQSSWPGSANELADFLGRLSILYPPAGADVVQHQTATQMSDRDVQTPRPENAATTRQFVQLPEAGINLKERIAEIEIQYIREALEVSNGVVAQAAKLLGLRRTTLVEKLRKYGIQR